MNAGSVIERTAALPFVEEEEEEEGNARGATLISVTNIHEVQFAKLVEACCNLQVPAGF